MRERWLIVGAGVGIAAGVALVLLLARGEQEADEALPPATAVAPTQPEGGDAHADRARDKAGRQRREAEPRSDAAGEARRAVVAAYRDYIQAIGERDGEALCRLLDAGFERELKLPVIGGGCAQRLRRSIGYEDPRGFPVWERTDLEAIETVAVDRSSARVTATIVTAFADREQPSIESDVAYLEQRGGGWRLAKASGALHRAVGRPDVPPQVIAPP